MSEWEIEARGRYGLGGKWVGVGLLIGRFKMGRSFIT